MTTGGKIALAAGLVGLGVAGRLLPHAWNFTPIIAITLVAGHYLGKKFSVWIPLAAMLVGDYWLGFYEAKLMLVVYLSLAFVGLVSSYSIKHLRASRVLAVSTISSSIFFLSTNLAVWQFSAWYPKTLAGLTECYLAGLPFFRNALFGDVFYTTSLFLVIELGFYFFALRSTAEKQVKATI